MMCKISQAQTPVIKFVSDNYKDKSVEYRREIIEMLYDCISIIADRVIADVLADKKVDREIGVLLEDNLYVVCKILQGNGKIIIEKCSPPEEFTNAHTGFKYKWDGSEWIKGELDEQEKLEHENWRRT